MYDKGRGIPQGGQLAYIWSNLAAAGATNKDLMEKTAGNRDLAAEKLIPAQPAQAQKWAREWRPKPGMMLHQDESRHE